MKHQTETEKSSLKNSQLNKITGDFYLRILALKIHQFSCLQDILELTFRKIRELLQADRVRVYQLKQDGIRVVVSESLVSVFLSLLSRKIFVFCLLKD